MSDIVLVEPCVFYALEGGINHAAAAAPGTAAGTCVDLTATPHTHMALYEWIRSFVESGWEARHGASFSVHDLEEAEAVLRELIALDESQVRMHRITTCHVAWLQCDQQRRQRDIAVTEALSRYQLHRLLHWEQRLSAGDDND
ncbi:hypothetical protein DQ04_21991010, partial [Trypanosoma grayi]|uniref:hypothetical protein n=1 Tax=Trypanosoma grayi TaxID=71804 RepID=UPI0004F4372C